MGKGRPVDPVWQEFECIFECGRVSKAKCKKCGEEISAKADRLNKHVNNKHRKGDAAEYQLEKRQKHQSKV